MAPIGHFWQQPLLSNSSRTAVGRLFILYLVVGVLLFTEGQASLIFPEQIFVGRDFLDEPEQPPQRSYTGTIRSPGWIQELAEVEMLLGINRPDSDLEISPSSHRSKRVEEKDFSQFNSKAGHEHHIHVHVKHHHPPANIKWQYIAIASVCSIAACSGLITAAACWFRILQQRQKHVETGLGGNAAQLAGDKRLAQSAQMYHFQQQKQQMIAAENGGSFNDDSSEEESDIEEAAEDFTVYECPGMAVAGEMEVQNPMFQPELPSPTGTGSDVADQ